MPGEVTSGVKLTLHIHDCPGPEEKQKLIDLSREAYELRRPFSLNFPDRLGDA